MRWDRIRRIAGREWRSTVMRTAFIVTTLLLPIVGVVLVALQATQTSTIVRHEMNAPSLPVAIVDTPLLLNPDAYRKPFNGTTFVLTADSAAARRTVAEGKAHAAVVLAPDYLATGNYTIYKRAATGIFGNAGGTDTLQINAALRAGLVNGRIAHKLADRIVRPAGDYGPKTFEWNAQSHSFKPPDIVGDASKFFVPYAMSMLLLISITMGTSYLLHGIAEEKESRIMEVLLSSVTHEELLQGKLIGLGAAGLTQILAWALMAGIPAILLLRLSPIPIPVSIAPSSVMLAVVLYLLGFTFYGSIMAGLGALMSSARESQQVTSYVMMVTMIPIFMMMEILDSPNGPAARILSWLPLTAPITLIMRTTAGHVPLWDVSLSLLLLILGTVLVQKLTAKLFRLGLLLYGKPPSVAEVMRWLRAA